jgi:hypothetical protein
MIERTEEYGVKWNKQIQSVEPGIIAQWKLEEIRDVGKSIRRWGRLLLKLNTLSAACLEDGDVFRHQAGRRKSENLTTLGNERLQVATATSMKIIALWYMVPCSLVEADRRFREACCLHHQGDRPGLLQRCYMAPHPRRLHELQPWEMFPTNTVIMVG